MINQGVSKRSRTIPKADDQATSDLCVAAARQALERSGTRPEELDLIIVATDTPDYLSPATFEERRRLEHTSVA